MSPTIPDNYLEQLPEDCNSCITDKRNWDAYLVDGKLVKLSPNEALKLQGFPGNYEFTVSEAQAMKQLGSAAAVPAVKETAKNIIELITE